MSLTLEESLKVERFKVVTSRQAWVVDVARGVFTGYVTIFAAFIAGAVSLATATNAVARLGPDLVARVLLLVAAFITCVAIASTIQISFCLWRWYEYRQAECKIYSEVPKPEAWAIAFELGFIAMMGASVGLVWFGYGVLVSFVQAAPSAAQ